MAGVYLTAIEQLAGSDDYLSIKLPALRFSSVLTASVAAAAKARGVRLHCDSHDIETSPQMQRLVDEIQGQGVTVSYTLPGRWSRSLDDADWAAERGLTVRVVKGQWADPADPNRDLRAGFLEVVERLAGKPSHVAVASHDVPLAAQACVGCKPPKPVARWNCSTACRCATRSKWPRARRARASLRAVRRGLSALRPRQAQAESAHGLVAAAGYVWVDLILRGSDRAAGISQRLDSTG